MKYSDREGNVTETENSQDRLLKKMYTTVPGRMLVSILVNPVVSRIAGKVLSSRLSTVIIPSFCRANHIDLSEYESKTYTSYNDFFTRKIRPERRPMDTEPTHAICPCDSKLSIYPITDDSTFEIKQSRYTLSELLKDKKLAKRFEGGYACIFRLTVDDYHSYCYVDNGKQSRSRFIQGVLHTVNPVANEVYPIYKENSREYSMLRSEHFGRVLMMEVGALIVGKIVNYKDYCSVIKGEEKGHFEFGGSTVVLIFEKNTIIPDQDIITNTENDCETVVKMGERFAIAVGQK